MLLPLTRLAMSAFLLYGFGYIVPLLRRDLGISESTAGLHAIAIAVGTGRPAPLQGKRTTMAFLTRRSSSPQTHSRPA